jgi:protein-disulfide isomerase
MTIAGEQRPTSDDGQTARGGRFRLALDVVATVAAVAASVAVLWFVFVGGRAGSQAAPPAPPIPKEPVAFADAPVIGSPTAPVVIVEFSDFECPFCAKFTKEIWPDLKAKYVDTGKVQLAFRHLPLPMHKRAEPAAESAVCAAEQQKFWPVHDQLFLAAGKLEDGDLARYAADAGVEPSRFATCLSARATAEVKQDADAAKSLKLGGTPSFLIGRRTQGERVQVAEVVVGIRPLADFQRVVEKLLKG